MTLDIIYNIEKFAFKVKEWFIENGGNPILWIGIFLFGVFMFEVIYQSLNKD